MGIIKLPRKSVIFFKRNLDKIFNSGNLAEGSWNEKLAQFVKSLTSANSTLPTSSNGAGMVALLTMYRHYFGRTRVLIQSNTMYGVKTMVPASGCKLSGFIQCRINSLMPSYQDVISAINPLKKTEKDKLIILISHIGGIINPDIQAIADLCKKENIILLEDCAHSFGATLYGKHSGLFGNAGVYSFYATKAIPAGEGGMIVTNNNDIGDMVKSFSIYDRFEQKLQIGNNIRISEVQALLIYSIVEKWDHIVKNKMKIADQYIEACKQKNIKYISQNENGHFGNYYKFILYTSEKPIKEVLPNLKTMTSPVYDYSIGVPNKVADFHVCLPIWYRQDSMITKKVCKEIYLNVSL